MARRLIILASAAVVAGAITVFAVLLLRDDAKALTRTEYIARVDRVCRDYNARLAKIPAPIAVGNPQAIAESIKQALPLVVERSEKVRAIVPPAALARQVRAMFILSDMAISDLNDAYALSRANKLAAGTRALGRFLRNSGRAKQVAREIGFDC